MNTNNATFTPVLGGNNGSSGALNIVRPSQLATDGVTGTIVTGIYEGSVVNKYNENQLDHKIRAENGDLTIINGTGSLTKQLSMVKPGMLVKIDYKGKEAIKSGPRKGKLAHAFVVSTADSSTEDSE